MKLLSSPDCLTLLGGLCSDADLPALGLVVFPAYIRLVRKLQRTYFLGKLPRLLSAAASRILYMRSVQSRLGRTESGASMTINFWCFSLVRRSCSVRPSVSLLWMLALPRLATPRGLLLLRNRADHPHIRPRSIHSRDVVDGFKGDFMYLGAVAFINEARAAAVAEIRTVAPQSLSLQVKSGAPFAEHSPVLNDIAELPTWRKVNDGLAKSERDTWDFCKASAYSTPRPSRPR